MFDGKLVTQKAAITELIERAVTRERHRLYWSIAIAVALVLVTTVADYMIYAGPQWTLSSLLP